MKNFFKKNNITLVFSIGMVLVSFAFLYTVLYFVSTKNKNARATHERYLEKVALQEKTEALRDEVEQTSEKREYLEGLFITHDTTVPFLTYIEGLSKTIGLTSSISEVDYEKAENEAFENLRVSVSTKGDYLSLIRYMNILENIPYEFTVQNESLKFVESLDPNISSYWEFSATLLVNSVKI